LHVRGLLVEDDEPVQPKPVSVQPQKAFPRLVQGADNVLMTEQPLMLRVSDRGFEVQGHDSVCRAVISTRELMVLVTFRRPLSLQDGFNEHCRLCGDYALDYDAYSAFITHMRGLEILYKHGDGSVDNRKLMLDNRSLLADHSRRVEEAIDAAVKAHEEAERARVAAGASPRIRVVPVMAYWLIPPLALGFLVSAARAHKDGLLQEHYHFVPDWQARWHRLEPCTREDGVYLFSNYMWSHLSNLRLSKRIKAANPRSLTIHGGPDTPRYAHDLENYMHENQHIDVVVHGEGEATLCEILEAMAGHMGNDPLDLSPLKHVPGLSFRLGDRIVSTAPRAQIKDLDSIPSPFLEGLFEPYAGTVSSLTLETNRGCPYGCTFCDWGAATLSKVRKFDLERVFAELEWCAKNRVKSVGLADANFGMFERDVQIVEKVVELKRKYGYPRAFGSNYAKNKIKYLSKIVLMLKEAGIMTQGLLALQSLDENVLSVVKRSNIKTEKYDELASEFRKIGLPLYVDIMLGLPGSTLATFKNDLQACIDREVNANIFSTQVLVNSPMNDPAYKAEHGIETITIGGDEDRTISTSESSLYTNIVVACNTYTREDHARMQELRRMYYLFENFGVLRQFSRFLRQESGTREIDFYDFLIQEVRAKPEAWPVLAVSLKVVPEVMVPPGSWRAFVQELERFAMEHYGLAGDNALRTALDVQHALLPARDRHFPLRLMLDHDYAAWHAAMLAAKDAGQRENWENVVPRLRDYPAASFEVMDDNEVCKWSLNSVFSRDYLGDWEFQSPVSRVLSAKQLQLREESA